MSNIVQLKNRNMSIVLSKERHAEIAAAILKSILTEALKPLPKDGKIKPDAFSISEMQKLVTQCAAQFNVSEDEFRACFVTILMEIGIVNAAEAFSIEEKATE